MMSSSDVVEPTEPAAASLLSRFFTWLLPMLVGFVPLVMWRRQQRRAGRDPDVLEL